MDRANPNLFGDEVQAYSIAERQKELSSGSTYRAHILIDCGPEGMDFGAYDVKKRLWGELEQHRLDNVKLSSIRSLPGNGKPPVVVIYPDEIWYEDVKVEDASRIIEEHLISGEPIDDLVFDPEIRDDYKLLIVCTFLSQCGPEGGGEVLKYFTKKARGIPRIHVIQSYGCLKECSMGPMACTYPDGNWFSALEEYKFDEVWESIEKDEQSKFETGLISLDQDLSAKNSGEV